MERLYFIYLYTFSDGKVYIGQTYHGSHRFGKSSDYKGQKVYQAMIKDIDYKKDILDEHLTKDEVDERERYWIAYYDSMNPNKGYNMESGGNHNKLCPGRKLTEEHKKHIAESHIGMHHSEETKRKLSEANKGKPMLPQTREALLKANTGRKMTEQNKKALIKANKRSVRCIEENLVFDSLKAAAEWCNGCHSNISSACSGRHKTAYGYHWKYEEEGI